IATEGGCAPSGNGNAALEALSGAAGGDGGAAVQLARTDQEPPGSNCPKGGIAVRVGADLDHDGALDDDEVVSTTYTGNGSEGVLDGSFVIHNEPDVELLAQYTRVTGDIMFDGPGLTSVSLPALEVVNGSIGRGGKSWAPTIATIDLPSLTAVGAFELTD